MLFGKSIVAIIPVRLGSRRLKYKNLKIFKGKPLFLSTLLLAKKCKMIDEVIVSSENKNILLKLEGIKNVVFRLRPKKLASDKAKASGVILDVLKKTKISFDYFIYLQPTSPLRNIFDIECSLKKVICKNRKSLTSVSENNFAPNGAIYISKVDEYIKTERFLKNFLNNYKMPKNRSIDIDHINDFEKAKRINL